MAPESLLIVVELAYMGSSHHQGGAQAAPPLLALSSRAGGGTRGSYRSPTCSGRRAMSGCIATAFTTTENTASATAQPPWPATARPTTPAPITSTLATGRATGPP